MYTISSNLLQQNQNVLYKFSTSILLYNFCKDVYKFSRCLQQMNCYVNFLVPYYIKILKLLIFPQKINFYFKTYYFIYLLHCYMYYIAFCLRKTSFPEPTLLSSNNHNFDEGKFLWCFLHSLWKSHPFVLCINNCYNCVK